MVSRRKMNQNRDEDEVLVENLSFAEINNEKILVEVEQFSPSIGDRRAQHAMSFQEPPDRESQAF